MGVRVNAIVCAQVENQGLQDRMEADPVLRSNFLRGLPIGRLGRPEEIKGLAILLASDASSFMTGALVPLDGGQSCQERGRLAPRHAAARAVVALQDRRLRRYVSERRRVMRGTNQVAGAGLRRLCLVALAAAGGCSLWGAASDAPTFPRASSGEVTGGTAGSRRGGEGDRDGGIRRLAGSAREWAGSTPAGFIHKYYASPESELTPTARSIFAI